MVMATDILFAAQQVKHEDAESESDMGEVIHEQLVRHVLAVSGELESRSDVWGEHSYARARGAATNSQIRSLLPDTEPDLDVDDLLDVDTAPRSPPAPPFDNELAEERELEDDADDADDDDDEDWERRLAGLAPSAVHARLARAAVAALLDMRLERLAGARGRWARRESAGAAAHRLRRALAAHWDAAAWLHAALLACLPRAISALYAEVTEELRREVPRLAERLAAPRPAAPPVDPLAFVADMRNANAPGPWLAWAPGGCEADDARWVRRLGALMHTRVLRAAPSPASPAEPAGHAPPDRWCAALAHDARTALADVLAEAGRRAVLVGGAGAGAALGAWLAAGVGARVRGVLLLAPPLLTAEGPRDRPDDALEEVEVPMLAVVGGGAAQSWRGAAAEVACRFGEAERGAAPARRVLLVAGADDALRLPRALRRRLRLPQHALDAALAEEAARWAGEAAASAGEARARRRAVESEERTAGGGNRSVEIIEGRVVSRGSGGSPLALPPPRRLEARLERPEHHERAERPERPERPDGLELAAADIMQLPIVFADDETRALVAPPPGETRRRRGAGVRGAGRVRGATRGALRYTRVVVAKRGARPVLLRRRAAHAPPSP